MSKLKKIFLGSLLLVLLGGILSSFYFSAKAGTLTTVYDRLSRMRAGLTSGVDHTIVFTPATTVDASGGGYAILKLEFPDNQDASWCATAGTDLTVVGSTEDGATALPGTLTAKCTQGGAGTGDAIYVCASGASATWTSGTKYGVKVSDGTTAKLGTYSTPLSDIKVTVTTGTDPNACGDPTTTADTGSLALAVIADDQLAVTATVDPLFSFSISQNSLDFGTFSNTNKRWATGGAGSGGSTTEPGAGQPTQITISTNAPNGAVVYARSQGDGSSAGLYKSSSPTYLIPAVASSAVSSGSEGYGLYVKNAGANLTVDEGFDNDGVSDVAISTSDQLIVSASGSLSSGNTADITLVAAISASTPAGSYQDTITITAAGKF